MRLAVRRRSIEMRDSSARWIARYVKYVYQTTAINVAVSTARVGSYLPPGLCPSAASAVRRRHGVRGRAAAAAQCPGPPAGNSPSTPGAPTARSRTRWERARRTAGPRGAAEQFLGQRGGAGCVVRCAERRARPESEERDGPPPGSCFAHHPGSCRCTWRRLTTLRLSCRP